MALEHMTWTFYTAPESQYFVCSDNPVFIPLELGLGKNTAELSFPISSYVMLLASWSKTEKGGFAEASLQAVKELNRRTIGNASQRVYASHSADWIANTLHRGNHDYRPIVRHDSQYEVVKIVPDVTGSKGRLAWNSRWKNFE
jgi:hypothetical protein